jgi:hypothetical protein
MGGKRQKMLTVENDFQSVYLSDNVIISCSH